MTTTQTRRRAIVVPMPNHPAPGGVNDTQQANVQAESRVDPPAGSDPLSAIPGSTPNGASPGGTPLAGHHFPAEVQAANVASDQPADRHTAAGAHLSPAVGLDGARDPAAIDGSTPIQGTLLDPALALAADVLDDIERVRIANENRLRALTRSEADSDGEIRGFGLDERHPDVARLAAIVATLAAVEKDATKNLEKVMRRHPLYGWSKGMRGVGDKQVARLLAAIGDPYIRPEIAHDDGAVTLQGPRTVSALWAYCGLHVLPASHTTSDTHRSVAGREQTTADQRCLDNHTTSVGGDGGDPGHASSEAYDAPAGVAPKRTRGQKTRWSTKAKTRVYLIAESCVKQRDRDCADGHIEDCGCSPYRRVYDEGRAKYTDAAHRVPCARCGPAGRPAVAGSALSDGHKHARAMRLVMKEVLKDLWRAARHIHEPDAT